MNIPAPIHPRNLELADALPALLATAGEPSYRLTPGGWAVMLLSVGFVTLLTAWCVYKVLTTQPDEQHVHAPPVIDTRDRED